MNIKKLNEDIKKLVVEDFGRSSVITKDIAILRFIAGAIALSSPQYSISYYNENDKVLEISTGLYNYTISIENGEAYLHNMPDGNHDEIEAEAKIDFEVPDITNSIIRAIEVTEKDLYNELQKIKDDTELSIAAKDILS